MPQHELQNEINQRRSKTVELFRPEVIDEIESAGFTVVSVSELDALKQKIKELEAEIENRDNEDWNHGVEMDLLT